MPRTPDMPNSYFSQLYRNGNSEKSPPHKPEKLEKWVWIALILGLLLLCYGMLCNFQAFLPEGRAQMKLVGAWYSDYDEEEKRMDYRLFYEYTVNGKTYEYEESGVTSIRMYSPQRAYVICYDEWNPSHWIFESEMSTQGNYLPMYLIGWLLTGGSLIILLIHWIKRLRQPQIPKPKKVRVPKEKKPRRNRYDEDGFFANDKF